MGDIAVEVARIGDALAGPRMRLVNTKWAPIILAVFGSAFGPRSKSVKSERLHALVDQALDELQSQGYDVPPDRRGRTLCLEWMNNQWLRRIPDDEGGEAYELTYEALAAQRVMEAAARDQTTLSESRLTTIISTVRRWAREASPDRAARIASLDEEIARLTEERDRLTEGGELAWASNDQMRTGYADVIDLVAQLPGDFRRVEEDLETICRQMLQSFRADDRSKGEALDEYLAASDRLTEQTEGGKAYDGALTVLNDRTLLDELKANLRSIMEHPFATTLSPRERQEFLGVVSILRQGANDIQERQRRVSAALREQLMSHDTAKERELSSVLQKLNEELGVWMTTARPHDKVPMPWMPAHHEIEYLRTRFYDPANDRPVPTLEDVSGEAPMPPGLEEVRSFGGPLLREVRVGLAEALMDGAATLGSAFNDLTPELRRPVEIYGILQLATSMGALEASGSDSETVQTVRPDGTTRRFLVPQLPATAEQVQGMKEFGDE